MSIENETAIKRVLSAGKGRQTVMQERKVSFIPENETKSNRFDQLSPLYKGEPDIHYDPFSGAILFRSYLSMANTDTKNGHGPQETKTKVRINEYMDVEAAIRSCLHRLGNVGRKRGVAVQNVLMIANHISFVLDGFATGRVTKTNIPLLAEETERVLSESGYARAVKPNKRLIASKMRRALEEDSLDRPKNDLRTIVMMASAWTRSHEENIHSKTAQAKYERLLSTLIASRSISRHGLTRMQSTLTSHFGLGRDFDGKLHARRQQLPPNQVSRVVQDIARVSKESLQDYQIKVAPYRQAALATKYLFFGVNPRRNSAGEDYEYMLQQLVGSDWFAHLDDFPPMPLNGAGLSAPAFARDVVTRGVMAGSMIEAALTQGDQGMQGQTTYDALLAENSAVDIWSATEETFR